VNADDAVSKQGEVDINDGGDDDANGIDKNRNVGGYIDDEAEENSGESEEGGSEEDSAAENDNADNAGGVVKATSAETLFFESSVED
jgi:hypothetical protein